MQKKTLQKRIARDKIRQSLELKRQSRQKVII